MKLMNKIKNNHSVDVNTLLMLVMLCVIFIFFIAMTGCLLGRVVVFFKTDILCFDWEMDAFYSVKVSASAGTLSGIGIWIKSWLQERKARKGSTS